VLGLLAAWGANNWVKNRLDGESDRSGYVKVVAAALEITYGTKLDSRHLRLIELPSDAVPASAINNIDDVVGMVAMTNVERGEVLNQTRLAEHEKGSTLAALIDPSKRAITVRVDDVVGVAGFLLPGNHVDVLASRVDIRTKRATTETILRNLKVLAVDQTASTEQDEPVIVRAVTLEMTPNQSETLVKAREEGTIQLTLRNPLEQEVATAPPKPVAPAVERVKAPVVRAAPRTSGQSRVQVIRGTRVQNEKARI
jgi:pilus assembly protein CpaB